MKRRPPSVEDSVMPAELAAGPGDGEAGMRVWLNACTAWSTANGHGRNGWRELLPASVRIEYLPSALERHRQLCEGH